MTNNETFIKNYEKSKQYQNILSFKEYIYTFIVEKRRKNVKFQQIA